MPLTALLDSVIICFVQIWTPSPLCAWGFHWLEDWRALVVCLINRCYLVLASWDENFLAIFNWRSLEGTTLLSCVSIGEFYLCGSRAQSMFSYRCSALQPWPWTLCVDLMSCWVPSDALLCLPTLLRMLSSPPGTQRSPSPISKVICVFYLGVLVHSASPHKTRGRNSLGAEVKGKMWDPYFQ